VVPTVIAPRVEMTVFDLSWGHFIVVAVVALIVIGPKDLPGVLRTIGQWTTRVRRMAAEFQGQFQEALREAEMADLHKEIGSIRDTARGFTSSLNDPVQLDEAMKWEPNPDPPKPATANPGTPEASATPEAGSPEAGSPEAGTPGAGTSEAGTPEVPTPASEISRTEPPAAPTSAHEPAAHEPAGTGIGHPAAPPAGALSAAERSEGGDRP